MNTDLEALLRDAGRTPPASGIDVARAVGRGRTVRRRRRLTGIGAAVALLAGTTVALTGLPGPDRTPGPAATAAVDPVLTHRRSTMTMDALITGRIERHGDCLVLDRGGDRTVVVWPSGTGWSADAEVVVLPGGLRAGLGDEVAGAGGYVPAGRARLGDLLGTDTADRAIRCAKPFGRSVVLIDDVEVS